MKVVVRKRERERCESSSQREGGRCSVSNMKTKDMSTSYDSCYRMIAQTL